MDANLETLSISGASSAPAQDEVLNTPEHSDTGSQYVVLPGPPDRADCQSRLTISPGKGGGRRRHRGQLGLGHRAMPNQLERVRL